MGKKKNSARRRGATDPAGREFRTEKEMCEAWHVNYKTFSGRKRRGLPLEACLQPKREKPAKPAPADTSCRDHLGSAFQDRAAMLAAYGVKKGTFLDRLKKGATLEQALGQAPLDTRTCCRDHLGRAFPTKAAMCAHWGLTRDTYNDRIKAGWTQQQALESPLKKGPGKASDHLGNEYRTIGDMAAAYGLQESALRARLANGHGLEESLTAPSGRLRQPSDHTGRRFRTQKEMCAAWGISVSSYLRRIQAGMTVEQALSGKRRRPARQIPKTDHLGQEWPSVKAMCEHWGVNANTLRSDLEKGVPLGQSLESRRARQGQERPRSIDWAGREYSSAVDMARKLYVSEETMKYWKEKGGSAMDACESYWPGTDAGKYRVRECLGFPWFLCEDMSDRSMQPHAGEVVLHADQVIELKALTTDRSKLKHRAGSHCYRKRAQA